MTFKLNCLPFTIMFKIEIFETKILTYKQTQKPYYLKILCYAMKYFSTKFEAQYDNI